MNRTVATKLPHFRSDGWPGGAMSALPLSPSTRGRTPASVRSRRTTSSLRRCATAAAVGAVLVGGPAACNNTNDINVEPVGTSAPPSSSSSPAADEQATLLRQYRTFWASLARVSNMPASARVAALQPLATEPQLKSMLTKMRQLDAAGEVLYGENIPRASIKIAADGVSAVVNDCQDSSRAGTAERKTMAKLTVGVRRNHVVVTMKKTDGVWKVAFASYPKSAC